MKWLVERLASHHMTHETGERAVIYAKVVDADNWFEARVFFIVGSPAPRMDPLSPSIRCSPLVRKRHR